MNFSLHHRYTIRVQPNAKVNHISMDGDFIKVKVSALATDDQANKAVIKLFKTQLNLKICIISGLKSREKVLF